MEIGLVLLVLLVAAAGAYFVFLGQQKRCDKLRRLAAEVGWEFQPDNDSDHDDVYASFEVFRKGISRYAYNTLLGTIDVAGAAWPVRMGDYHYETTSHNGEHTTKHSHRFSYMLLELPYRRLPGLLVRREGMFDAVANLFGFDDIDFESAEFSRRFCVKCSDRRFAYDVLHPRMIEFLMEYEPPPIDLEAGRCLLGDGSSTWTVDELRATIDWVQHFFELWPAHVTSQLEQQP